eukprot:2413740-Ditylum_brightwellii.AAC.1
MEKTVPVPHFTVSTGALKFGVIIVEDITKAALTQEITVDGEETTLMTYLLTSNLGLESVEETNHTVDHGKWFLLFWKRYTCNIHNFVDYHLAKIFDDCICHEIWHPTITMPGQARASAIDFIDTYAEALNKWQKLAPIIPRITTQSQQM